METLSKEQALVVCEQVRSENRGKWYTYQAWWCWGCTTFTKGDVAQRCFAGRLDNRGCEQVNQWVERVNSK